MQNKSLSEYRILIISCDSLGLSLKRDIEIHVYRCGDWVLMCNIMQNNRVTNWSPYYRYVNPRGISRQA